MSYKVFTTDLFDREFKALCKKHQSAKSDVTEFVAQLIQHPQQGTPLGKDCYKIRIAIRSKGKGKSGGARLITRVRIVKQRIYLLSIYDKSAKETLTDKELQAILDTMTESE